LQHYTEIFQIVKHSPNSTLGGSELAVTALLKHPIQSPHFRPIVICKIENYSSAPTPTANAEAIPSKLVTGLEAVKRDNFLLVLGKEAVLEERPLTLTKEGLDEYPLQMPLLHTMKTVTKSLPL